MLRKQAPESLMRRIHCIKSLQSVSFKSPYTTFADCLDSDLGRTTAAHRDVVAHKLPGKGITHHMGFPPRGKMHIAKSPLFDQSAMAIALILTRERLPGSKRNKPPFGPEKFCKFMKLSSRDIAIEIHRRRLY